MRYMGSKARLAKDILPFIYEALQGHTNCVYVEPFMGGCNLLSQVDHPLKLGMDKNHYLVELWKSIRAGKFIPPMKLTEEEYYDMKDDYLRRGGKYSDAMLAYAMFCCSYGSKPWAGYARLNEKRGEDHIKEAWRNITKQVMNFKHLEGTKFFESDYTFTTEAVRDIFGEQYKNNMVIYCDPPYLATQGYLSDFNHDDFWKWVKEMALKGHKVFVSEYEAPNEFACIWYKVKKDGLAMYSNGKQQVDRTERLFVYDGDI